MIFTLQYSVTKELRKLIILLNVRSTGLEPISQKQQEKVKSRFVKRVVWRSRRAPPLKEKQLSGRKELLIDGARLGLFFWQVISAVKLNCQRGKKSNNVKCGDGSVMFYVWGS